MYTSDGLNSILVMAKTSEKNESEVRAEK